MRTRIAVCALAALSLAGCQKQEAAPAADAVAAPPAEAAAGQARADASPPPNLSIPQLAYVYRYALAAAPEGVRGLMARHEQACWAAGPTVCQVTGQSLKEDGEEKALVGALTLRARPDWLRTFRHGLETDAKAVGGRLVSNDTASDDLSRAIVDTEAALNAKTVLRDRLQETLRTRPGKATDFFEMEQQLAGVQAEIDAARTQLAAMKTRVATSELRIDYRSEGVLAPRGDLAPLGRAADDMVDIFIGTVALLLRALALLTPIGGLAALAWWIARQARRPKKAPTA